MTVPVIWLAKDGVCSRCRWDEQIVEDLLTGAQKLPAALPDLSDWYASPLGITGSVVVVLPGGNHVDDVGWVNAELSVFDSVILVITSDEGAEFPVGDLDHPNLKLWVQTPRPEVQYPVGTQFFGVGSGRAWEHVKPTAKEHRLFISAQRTHSRRDDAIANSARVSNSVVNSTTGFMQGMRRDEYLKVMSEAWWCPAPSGIQTQDSFRFYEALEMGSIPIPDGLRPDGQGRGYWNMVAPGFPVIPIEDWRKLRSSIDASEQLGKLSIQLIAHEWWHRRRRDMARTLANQVGNDSPHPLTVIVPTSPIPSHPDTKMLDVVIQSIRQRTDAEILITCDQPRPEMAHRAVDYAQYLHEVMLRCEKDWWNTTPIVMHQFCHQAEMMRRVLPEVDSEYILYVEHDAPLVGDIDFDAVIAAMRASNLNLMRFYHEVAVHPEHEHLMTGAVHSNGWRPTMQWSQRPHVAKRRFYERRVLKPNFATTARVMIEDVMHGICEHHLVVNGAEKAWDDWRMALWHPEGSIQRSTHLDGRGIDPKFDDRFKYRYPNAQRPAGAPDPRIGA